MTSRSNLFNTDISTWHVHQPSKYGVTCSVRVPHRSHYFIAGQHCIELGLRVYVQRRKGHYLRLFMRTPARKPGAKVFFSFSGLSCSTWGLVFHGNCGLPSSSMSPSWHQETSLWRYEDIRVPWWYCYTVLWSSPSLPDSKCDWKNLDNYRFPLEWSLYHHHRWTCALAIANLVNRLNQSYYGQ